MFLSKTLPLACLATLAFSSPLPRTPTEVLRRELPSPSAYPLEEGACEHEWQYLNFDTNNSNDVAHLKQLHHIICSGEMRALSSYGSGAASSNLAPYKRFYPQNDDEDNWDDLQAGVVKVLDLITGTSSSDGAIGSIVGSFIVDNTDFGAKYPDNANKARCDDEGTLAYTDFDKIDDSDDDGSDDGEIESDGLEKIHFCDSAWSRVNFEEVVSDCKALDPYPSEKMDTFSRIALHEMTHYSTVGPPSLAEGDMIQDVQMFDGEPAYGTVRAHALIDKNQEETAYNPGASETNADNYAWMSLDALVSRHCASDVTGDNWAAFFTQDPPAL